ncbi:site-specific integrase [Flavobacterium psychrophilum]|uniref:site-specific integrase n=1 Tax=Flavobacterium psychrophilum TaxID=96345 RepID=UPI001D08B048|nr:site-specific integrase [Flavobacterium psychrophilum]ELV7526096.1 site-specific integrase [Flavobacterium psychrophilum]MCB6062430.1 site-specific integrase [Flavobacterium psychrophilum]
MASIKLILRTHQADQTGHSPLYIRIIKDRKTKFITAGVKLKENEWDEVKQKVKKNHPNSARMNANLSQKIADAEGQVADMERKVKTVSIKKLKEAIKGKEVPNFFQYAYARCEKIKGSVSFGTYKNYMLYTKKFEKYVGTNDVYFDDITVSVLKDYMAHMGNVSKNGATTQRYSIMILAIMFKEAIKEDIIPEYMYPFNKLTLKKDTEKRVFLNKDQIEKLTNLELKEGKKADLWRDLFLFSIYAGGLRFSDVIELQYTNYNSEEQRIKKVIRKTGRLHQFKIGKVAIDILNKYIKEDAQPDDYIFPIITDKKSYNKNEEARYFIVSRENQSANFQLNRMGKIMKLPFSLSFHLSRHSFATNALNNGMRIEHVSKLMDHTDISTTQIYAKIISEELDKAVDSYIF